MKNKKGFVFLESVIVLVVVAIALTGFMTTYTILSNNAKRREFYDKTSDKYLLYAISSLGTSGNENILTCGTFYAKRDDAYDLCFKNFYSSEDDVKSMFDDTGLVYLYYLDGNSIAQALTKNETANYYPTRKFDNGSIEYIKTLDVNKDNYLIGVFRRSDRYYYASINL